jgi:hypothetical protein
MSSENRSITFQPFDSDVPPLNVRLTRLCGYPINNFKSPFGIKLNR